MQSQDADIVNISLGFEGIIDSYTEEDIRTHFGDTISAMAQEAASDKKFIVWAAGNNHGAACLPTGRHVGLCKGFILSTPAFGRIDAVPVEFMPGLAAKIEELRGHYIAAVAVARTATTMDTPRSPLSRTGAESPPTGASRHPAWMYSWRCSDGK